MYVTTLLGCTKLARLIGLLDSDLHTYLCRRIFDIIIDIVELSIVELQERAKMGLADRLRLVSMKFK